MPEETISTEHPLELDDSQQVELLASVKNDFENWKSARRPLEEKWRECWEAYLCDVRKLYAQPDEMTVDRSRIVRPVLYEAVEAIQANLLNAMFPSDERFFSVAGKTEADHRHANVIQEFLRNKLEELGFSEKFGTFLKQAIVTGNTVAAVPWRREARRRRVDQPVNLFGVTVRTEKATVEEILYNGPDFEVLDIFDFLVDPDEPDFEKAKVIRRVERGLHQLRQNPVYSNLEGLNSHTAVENDSNKLARRSSFGIEEGALTLSSSRKHKVALLEAWGDFRIGDRVYENYVCVVANGERVIRFEPNPYDHGMKPFVFTTFIPIPNETYGIGAIEKSLGLQHAINTLTNQKLDVINISINNPFTYLVNDDVFDPDTVVTRPGALIPVKSHETLRPIQYLNNFTVAFNEIADLKAEIQEATGALKFFTGGSNPDDHRRTATEISALISGGSQKFSNFISHLENTSLEPFLVMAFENAKQFLREPEMLRVARKDGSLEFIRILPEIIRRTRCSFRIDGSQGAIARGQELEAMVSFVRLVREIPELAAQVDLLPVLRKIYRRLGFKDEDQIFVDVQQFDRDQQGGAYGVQS